MPPNPSPVADTLHAYLPARPQLPPRPHRPRPHEVAVEAAVSLPISDSSCACLVLLTDEGSIVDGFSDISDEAHGYEAEEEEDNHADFPPHDDDLEEEGVSEPRSERERARRPAGVATSVRALPLSQDCAPTRRRRTKRSAPPEQPPTPGRRHTVEVAVGREWSCWDDVGRRHVSKQASGQSQGPGATGVRVGSPSSLEAVRGSGE